MEHRARDLRVIARPVPARQDPWRGRGRRHPAHQAGSRAAAAPNHIGEAASTMRGTRSRWRAVGAGLAALVLARRSRALPPRGPPARDSDHDGLTNAFEVHRSGTSPTRRDTDRDGISDAREDPDHDGLTQPDRAGGRPRTLAGRTPTATASATGPRTRTPTASRTPASSSPGPTRARPTPTATGRRTATRTPTPTACGRSRTSGPASCPVTPTRTTTASATATRTATATA